MLTHHISHPSHFTEWLLIILSLSAACFGIFLAWALYFKDRNFNLVRSFVSRFPFLYRVVYNKYYVDELYNATFVAGTLKSAELSSKFDLKGIDACVNGARHITVGTSIFSGFFDLKIIDGIVNFLGWLAKAFGNIFRKLQTGVVHNYAFVLGLGAFIALFIYIIL